MEWVEKTARSIDEAKDAALDALGVHEDDAEFEVVTEAKTGLFGRVKEDARVRARVRPTTPRSKDDRRRKRGRGGNGRNKGGKGGQGRQNGGESQNADGGGNGRNKGGRPQNDRPGKPSETKKPAEAKRDREPNRNSDKNQPKNREKSQKMSDEPSMPLPQQADLAEQFVSGLAEAMGADVTFAREDVADDEIRITVSGDNLGRMIGPRGGTAMAVDDLVRTVLQRHGSSRDGRIRVDIGGLRARRAEALASFCREQAAAVREDGKARVLDPMGGADRKVVHDTIADEDGVATESQGEDPNRRVIIVPAGDAG